MRKHISIPVGTSSFAEIRQEGYYYIDKSGLIEELLRTKGTKVTLITRPRRFGKTLGMSMLADYYGLPVILLMDEYDVPLAKASEKGYYPEMLDLIKGMMQVIKDNYSQVICYGISFYKKRCLLQKKE